MRDVIQLEWMLQAKCGLQNKNSLLQDEQSGTPFSQIDMCPFLKNCGSEKTVPYQP